MADQRRNPQPLDLLDDLPRGKFGEKLTDYTGPRARWLNRQEDRRAIEDSTLRLDYDPRAGAGIFLGQWEQGEYVGTLDDRHLTTISSSRSGKGTSAIIPNLLFYRGSIICVDPKAENANTTAVRRDRDLGQTVHVLDPFQHAAASLHAYRAVFNPMSLLLDPHSTTRVADAGLIADALVVPAAGPGRDSHWDETAKAFLEGLIVHVATYTKNYEGERDLVKVRDLLVSGTTFERGDQTAAGMNGLYSEMADNPAEDRFVIHAASDLQDKPLNERGSVLSTARRHTQFIDVGNLKAILRVAPGARTFELADLKRRPTTIFLCVPASRLTLSARWLRLFVNLVIEAVERVRGKPEPPVLMLLDEFPVLGYMKSLEDSVGQIAGYGMKMWTILQDLGQLKALYSERWETFLGNSGIVQFFGNNDVTTLEYIARRLGKATIEAQRTTQTTEEERRMGKTGETINSEAIDLIAPDEAARFFGRSDARQRQLILLPELHPVILRRNIYFHEDERLFRDARGRPLYDDAWRAEP